MTREQNRKISQQGGKAAQAKGTAHRFTSEEASAAGRKGGLKVSEDREHMRQLAHKRHYPKCAHESVDMISLNAHFFIRCLLCGQIVSEA